MNASTVMARLRVRPADHPASVSVRTLLGETAWFSLPATTRARFADHAASAEYRGEFAEVRASFAGRLLAMCCRLIGTPVAPFGLERRGHGQSIRDARWRHGLAAHLRVSGA